MKKIQTSSYIDKVARAKPLTPQILKEILRQNNKEKKTVRQIAKEMGINFSVLHNALQKYIEQYGGKIINNRNLNLDNKQLQEVLRQNNKEKKTVRQIAKEMGIKPGALYWNLKRYIEQYGGEIINHRHLGLSDKQLKEVLRQNNKEGKTIPEIAKEMGINIGTLYNALQRYVEQYGGEIINNRDNSKSQKINQNNTRSLTKEKFGSRNELIIQDIFLICKINYQNHIKLNIKERIFEPDYYFPTGDFYFEVFGFAGPNEKANQNYQNKQEFKIQNIPNLKYIDTKKSGEPGLAKMATMLDTQVCVKKQCGQSLFSNVSLQETLRKMIPSLTKFGINLAVKYIKKLQEMSPQQLGKARKAIERNPAQHQPFPKPLNDPNIFRQKSAQTEMITLEQMSQELSQQFKSVQYWLPEEIVAVYFKTPENLQAAMGNNQDQSYNFNQYQQQQQAPQQQQNYFNLNQYQQQQAPLARAASMQNYFVLLKDKGTA